MRWRCRFTASRLSWLIARFGTPPHCLPQRSGQAVSGNKLAHRRPKAPAGLADQCLTWVIHVISSVHKRLPLSSQLQTYRCIALSGAQGQSRHFRTAKNSFSPPDHREVGHRTRYADIGIKVIMPTSGWPSDLKFAFDQSMVATRQFGIKPMMLFHGGTRAPWSRECSGYGARKQLSATVIAEVNNIAELDLS